MRAWRQSPEKQKERHASEGERKGNPLKLFTEKVLSKTLRDEFTNDPIISLVMELNKQDKPEPVLLSENKNWSFFAYRGSATGKLIIAYDRLIKSLEPGFTLNVCCGLDPIGDVKVDLDLTVLNEQKKKLDDAECILADVHNLPFIPRAFDTIICDPPFNYYDRFKWVLHLSDLAKKQIILSHNGKRFVIPHFDRTLVYDDTNAVRATFLRMWWIFTRKTDNNHKLEVGT